MIAIDLLYHLFNWQLLLLVEDARFCFCHELHLMFVHELHLSIVYLPDFAREVLQVARLNCGQILVAHYLLDCGEVNLHSALINLFYIRLELF